MKSKLSFPQSKPETGSGHLYVAIELSRAKWLVALYADGDAKPRVHEIAGGDACGLLRLIEERRKSIQRKSGAEVQAISCFEAGYDGFWLHRFLSAHGVRSHVLDGASLLIDCRAKHVKTDGIDVRRLLRAIISYTAGDLESCRIVSVPTAEQEDARRTCRERQRLVSERTGHINRIKALLTSQGVRVSSVKDGRWMKRLDDMRTGDGRPLPSKLIAELTREWHRLVLVKQQLREVEAVRDDVVYGRETEPSVDGEKIRKLVKLRGIGPEFATLLTREVFFRTFRNRRSVAKYFGLTPAPYSSGDSHHDQGIDKSGNPRARAAALEAAWMWLRHQPASALAKWYTKQTRDASSRTRRINIIALARKLMIAVWRYLTQGLVPEGAVVSA